METYSCDHDLSARRSAKEAISEQANTATAVQGTSQPSAAAVPSSLGPSAEDLPCRARRAAQPPSQAVVFLTHRNAPRIYRHFERLRDDLRDTMPAFLCLHRPYPNMPKPFFQPDFVVTVEDEAATLPKRHLQRTTSGRTRFHYTDLAIVPAMLHTELDGFDHLWLVEEDLDYSGDWSVFFRWAGVSTADLIGFNFLSREQSPDWMHWQTFRCPNTVAASSQAHGLLMLSRFSNRFLRTYQEEIGNPGWAGHTEALYPTVALHHGLRVAAFGTTERHPNVSLVADEAGAADFADKSTFAARPVQGDCYFHEKPKAFTRRNRLVHPIKIIKPQLQAVPEDKHVGAEQPELSRHQATRTKTGFSNFASMPLWQFIEEERVADRLLIYLHIPKTAGSSFSEEWRQVLSPYRNIDIDHSPEASLIENKMEQAVRRFIGELQHEDFRSCSGHLEFPHVRQILKARPNACVVTFLRHPVDRLISEYRYTRTPQHPTFREVIATYPDIESYIADEEFQNPMLRRLTGTTDIDAAEAMRFLDEHYSFVGTYELFPMCFNIFFRLLGRNEMPTLHRMRTEDAPDNSVELTPELRHRILQLNEKDFAIYEHVRARLEAKRAEWALLDET